RRRGLLVVVTAFTFVSFSYSLLLTAADSSAAFYFVTSRAWELLAGSIAFFVPSGKRQFHFAIGMLLVIGSMFVGVGSGWPAPEAVTVVVGTCLILTAKSSSSWLEHSAIGHLGRASYSIYLWHWPLIVYSKIFL